MTGSSRLLVAVRSSLYLLDWNVPGDDALRLLTTVDVGLPDNLINDGKADAEGRFWLGILAINLQFYIMYWNMKSICYRILFILKLILKRNYRT